jgi:hypothetical protein
VIERALRFGWVLGAAFGTLLTACHGHAGPKDTERSSKRTRVSALRFAELIYDGALKNGWTDAGGGPRNVAGPGAASVSVSDEAGWIVSKNSLRAHGFGALVFHFKGGPSKMPFLEVRLQSSENTPFPRVRLGLEYLSDAGDGWQEALVPFSELNPNRARFDAVSLRGLHASAMPPLLLDKMGFTPAEGLAAILDPAAGGTVRHMAVDCAAPARSISPLVYGISYYAITDKEDAQWGLGATGRRWGGNSSTRYNWELNAWNTARDWYWENTETASYTAFLDANDSHAVTAAVTVPMIGWVAKDKTSFSFPVGEFGPQKDSDSKWRPQAGNGVDEHGTEIRPGPPVRTSVPASPDFVGRWVRKIRERDRARGHRSVEIYMLDNEPGLWSATHRDVHPDPLTYDELLQRTLAYGAAVRAADPEARIAGPAAWGWPEMFYSAKDSSVGVAERPDRRAHGDVPLLPWYLRRLREEEQRNGTHVLDLVDVHFYPQAEGIYGENGKVDPKSAALRIRSTRGLWDRSYTDESFIKEPIYLLPRLTQWIDENYPSRGIVIGEWNFGGERHMSGALATAEALGRFTQNGVAAAFYWTYPPARSPAFYAFRAFRNFDGKNGRFLDYSQPTVTADSSSLFASRDAEGKHLVVLALNLSPDEATAAEIDLEGCSPIGQRTAFVFSGASTDGFAADHPVTGEGKTIRQRLPPYSITVFDIRLESAIPTAVKPGP